MAFDRLNHGRELEGLLLLGDGRQDRHPTGRLKEAVPSFKQAPRWKRARRAGDTQEHTYDDPFFEGCRLP